MECVSLVQQHWTNMSGTDSFILRFINALQTQWRQ